MTRNSQVSALGGEEGANELRNIANQLEEGLLSMKKGDIPAYLRPDQGRTPAEAADSGLEPGKSGQQDLSSCQESGRIEEIRLSEVQKHTDQLSLSS